LPKEQKYLDRESSKKKADRFHELFKLREFYFMQISQIYASLKLNPSKIKNIGNFEIFYLTITLYIFILFSIKN